jgi:hypothetical protein
MADADEPKPITITPDVEAILAALYTDEPAYAAVARLCDEALDRSGALLGRVREAAYRARQT